MTEQSLRRGTWDDMYYFLAQQENVRKRMLALCACCRSTWAHVTLDCNREALEASERYADGLATLQELEGYWRKMRFEPAVYCEWVLAAAGPADRDDVHPGLGPENDQDDLALRSFYAIFTNEVRERWTPERIAFGLDVFGYLFHDATFSPSWRTDTAIALARQMYESRDFGAMPILADALQDAGCDNEDVLSHCRDTKGTHVRGCWVVDMVLGKA